MGIFSRVVRVCSESRLPKDTKFHARNKTRWCGYWLVEMGATEHTVLLDTLHCIQAGDADGSIKVRQLLGLRIQALAYSLRTNRGRIPFDANSEASMTELALYPSSALHEACIKAAELSDIPWLAPSSSENAASTDNTQSPPEESHENP